MWPSFAVGDRRPEEAVGVGSVERRAQVVPGATRRIVERRDRTLDPGAARVGWPAVAELTLAVRERSTPKVVDTGAACLDRGEACRQAIGHGLPRLGLESAAPSERAVPQPPRTAMTATRASERRGPANSLIGTRRRNQGVANALDRRAPPPIGSSSAPRLAARAVDPARVGVDEAADFEEHDRPVLAVVHSDDLAAVGQLREFWRQGDEVALARLQRPVGDQARGDLPCSRVIDGQPDSAECARVSTRMRPTSRDRRSAPRRPQSALAVPGARRTWTDTTRVPSRTASTAAHPLSPQVRVEARRVADRGGRQPSALDAVRHRRHRHHQPDPHPSNRWHFQSSSPRDRRRETRRCRSARASPDRRSRRRSESLRRTPAARQGRSAARRRRLRRSGHRTPTGRSVSATPPPSVRRASCCRTPRRSVELVPFAGMLTLLRRWRPTTSDGRLEPRDRLRSAASTMTTPPSLLIQGDTRARGGVEPEQIACRRVVGVRAEDHEPVPSRARAPLAGRSRLRPERLRRRSRGHRDGRCPPGPMRRSARSVSTLPR